MRKKNTKIVSQTENESGGIDFILKNGTWLGEVIDFLPNGIINKGVTGIGATTMELNCDRNSIVIQPLKITVEQKSWGTYNHKVFAYNTKKSSGLNKALISYLDDTSVKFKKIILVIDRLEDLIFILGERVLKYFFLFDEIDYMQGSSTYRKKMETGLDLGKVLDNFALVSATHIGFSDPELKKLKTYNFSYHKQILRSIQTHYITSVKLDKRQKEKATLNKLFSCICYMLTESKSKILVAVNNVKLINDLAEALIKANKIIDKDVTLLISDNNLKNKLLIKEYSGLQISNYQLPTRLNFITSAYFNGYDLKEEDLCLIIYSSPNYPTNLISANEIKQIYGRNRIENGTTNFFVFTHDIKENELKDAELLSSKESDWIERGNSSVEMQNCIDKHLHKLTATSKNNDYFTKFFKEQSESIEFNLSRSKYIFTKENFIEVFFNPLIKQIKNSVSYLQIDHLRYYYNYLSEMYVMTEFEMEITAKGKVNQVLFFNTVNYRFTELLLKFGFNEVKNKIEWPKLIFTPEKSTHELEIKEALNEVETAIKTKTIEKNKFNNLQQIVFNIIETSKQLYTIKSTKETIMLCDSKNKLDLLFEFIKEGDFKKTNKYLLIKGKLKENHPYTIEELIDVATNAADRTQQKGKMTKIGALLLVRLVFKTELIHKHGSKTGEKLYVLEKHNPFNTLIKNKKKKNAALDS